MRLDKRKHEFEKTDGAAIELGDFCVGISYRVIVKIGLLNQYFGRWAVIVGMNLTNGNKKENEENCGLAKGRVMVNRPSEGDEKFAVGHVKALCRSA